SVVVAEDHDLDRRTRVRGSNHHARLGIVAEYQVRLGVRKGGLVTHRVTIEVDAVRLSFDDLVTTSQHGIEQRGGELAYSAAHRIVHFALHDGGRHRKPIGS